MLQDDSTLDSLRATRHEISASCNHDPQALVTYYIELQQQYEQRLLKDEPESPAEASLPILAENVTKSQITGS